MYEFTVPAHVPEHLVRDFDFLQLPAGSDVYPWLHELHTGPDIFFTPRNMGHWVLTRHDDIAVAMSSYQEFSSRHQFIPKEGIVLKVPPIDMDPPLHGEFRRIIAPFFTPKAIGNLEQRARDLTNDLIDAFYDRGECDFIAEFALKMPIGIFMALVDLPDTDRLALVEMAEKMIRGVTIEEQRQGFQDSFDYLEVKFEERARGGGSDLLTAVAKGHVHDRALTREEKLGMGSLLLSGGLDTVAGALGFITRYLAENPDQRRMLVEEPKRIFSAVEELLRRFEIANVGRVVAHDMVYKGVFMKEGDMVLTATSLAGMDERRYPEALKVDFDRRDKRSIVFGRGPHQCIGAYLARTELRVFLAEWLKRIPEFSIRPGSEVRTAAGRANTVHSLLLNWPIANAGLP